MAFKLTLAAFAWLLIAIFKFDCVTSRCGRPRIHFNAMIVKGVDTKAGEWPWHAAIQHRKGQNKHYVCGGTLINRNFVLTAAHCTFDEGVKLPNRKIYVQLGVHDLNKFKAQQLTVDKVHRHADFSASTMANDIALLELGEEAEYNEYVIAVCLQDLGDLSGQQGTTVGWGFTSEDKLSNILQKAVLPVNNMIDCMQTDRDTFVGNLKALLCVGSRDGTAVCNGDSGGGIFFERNGAWVLGGITSYTKQRPDGTNICATNGYAAFTNVVVFRSWIERIIGEDIFGQDSFEEPEVPVRPSPPKQPQFSTPVRISNQPQPDPMEFFRQQAQQNHFNNIQNSQRFSTNPGVVRTWSNIPNQGTFMGANPAGGGYQHNVFYTNNGVGQHTSYQTGGPGNYYKEESYSFHSSY